MKIGNKHILTLLCMLIVLVAGCRRAANSTIDEQIPEYITQIQDILEIGDEQAVVLEKVGKPHYVRDYGTYEIWNYDFIPVKQLLKKSVSDSDDQQSFVIYFKDKRIYQVRVIENEVY